MALRTMWIATAFPTVKIWEDTVTKGNYDISITLTTSGVASYSTAFRYFMGELRDGESSWLWGTIRDDSFRDTYYAMTQAVNDDQYVENCIRNCRTMWLIACLLRLCAGRPHSSPTVPINIPDGKIIPPGVLFMRQPGIV